MNGRFDHTAVVVRDINEALERYAKLYGVTPSLQADVPEQQVAVAFLPFGDTQLELISPLHDDSGVARFLASHGEALHHIAFAVPDLQAELDRLDAAGVRLIDRHPRDGVHGLIAFIHPRGTGGVLTELVQNRRDTAGLARDHR